jgi:predicted metal-binding protein
MFDTLFTLNGPFSFRSSANSDLPSTDIVHACHVCTSCDRGDSSCNHQVDDIENLEKRIATGEACFLRLLEELEKNGWRKIASNPSEVRGQDAGIDPRYPTVLLENVDNEKVKLRVLPTRCLSACSFPNVIALSGGAEKFALQFGAINDDHFNDITSVIQDYCASNDGYSCIRSRPRGLRSHVLARIPPLNGRKERSQRDAHNHSSSLQ